MCFTAALPLWPKSSKLSVNTSASTSTRRTSEEVTGRQHTPAAVCVCVCACIADVVETLIILCVHILLDPPPFWGCEAQSMGLCRK